MSECYCKNYHENFQNEKSYQKKKSLGAEPNKKIFKKVNLNTKGKVNLNGFEVIQTIHCSYQLGELGS